MCAAVLQQVTLCVWKQFQWFLSPGPLASHLLCCPFSILLILYPVRWQRSTQRMFITYYQIRRSTEIGGFVVRCERYSRFIYFDFRFFHDMSTRIRNTIKILHSAPSELRLYFIVSNKSSKITDLCQSKQNNIFIKTMFICLPKWRRPTLTRNSIELNDHVCSDDCDVREHTGVHMTTRGSAVINGPPLSHIVFS